MYALALPALSVLTPQLSSDIFRTEVKQGKFAVSALHSRAMQQLDAAVAVMKHSLDAQLVVRRPRGWLAGCEQTSNASIALHSRLRS